jgi:hypothetical protein
VFVFYSGVTLGAWQSAPLTFNTCAKAKEKPRKSGSFVKCWKPATLHPWSPFQLVHPGQRGPQGCRNRPAQSLSTWELPRRGEEGPSSLLRLAVDPPRSISALWMTTATSKDPSASLPMGAFPFPLEVLQGKRPLCPDEGARRRQALRMATENRRSFPSCSEVTAVDAEGLPVRPHSVDDPGHLRHRRRSTKTYLRSFKVSPSKNLSR